MTNPCQGSSNQTWVREGLILRPPAEHAWWATHAQAPTIHVLDGRLWRIYFGARDNQPVSRIMCVDVDPRDGMKIVKLHPDPVLEVGAPGTFDCHGVGPACTVIINNRIHLYYTGIVRRHDVPFTLAIGVAVSDDGLNFSRLSEGPVFATGPRDPYFASTPQVRRCESRFEMWYSSGLGWSHLAGEAREEPLYNIRRSWSPDGLIWGLDTEHVLGEGHGDDGGVVRPWVLGSGRQGQVWYCTRGAHEFRDGGAKAYRINHAVLNEDGSTIQASSQIRFQNHPSRADWDGEMQAYPCVERSGDDLMMVYNGNRFGRSGFGYARLAGGADEIRR